LAFMGCIGWRGEGRSVDQAVRPSDHQMELDEDVIGRWTFYSIFIPPIITLYVISRSYAMLYFTILLLFLVLSLTDRYCSTRLNPLTQNGNVVARAGIYKTLRCKDSDPAKAFEETPYKVISRSILNNSEHIHAAKTA